MTTIRHSQYFDVDSRMSIGYYSGSDLSGADGTTNRILTLPNAQLTTREEVFVDGLNLHSSLFTISRATANTTITLSRPTRDRQLIVVTYWLT